MGTGKFVIANETENQAEQYRTYGQQKVGFGAKPAVLVVDLQKAFTDPAFSAGGAPLIERAVENTARLLDVARKANVPVA